MGSQSCWLLRKPSLCCCSDILRRRLDRLERRADRLVSTVRSVSFSLFIPGRGSGIHFSNHIRAHEPETPNASRGTMVSFALATQHAYRAGSHQEHENVAHDL